LSAADEYWSLDIPGLTEHQAVSLQERLAGEFEDGIIVASPRHFMVRGFDRASVNMLVSCLRAGLATGGMSDEDEAGVKAMLEDFDAWLDQAEDTPR
jgi:hypothetical protein